LNPPVEAEGSLHSLFYLQTLRKRREIPANGRSYCSLPEEKQIKPQQNNSAHGAER